jgi:Raf kinase inhibitor-like YbhB/YbcL family protein
MWRGVPPALLLLGLASCGATGAKGDKPVAGFQLSSSAFANGQPIPRQYTCDGANQSPPLQWSEPPRGTRSFALIVDDPDAPGGTFRHWGAYDIPATVQSVGAGQSIGSQAANDFGKPGYGGPCPPRGHGAHHYRFKLFALDVARLDLSPKAKVADVERAAGQHTLGRAELIGIYERK